MTKEKFNDVLYRIGNGDNTALEKIFNEYYGSMKATAFFILHNESDAEDVASNALVKVFDYAKRKPVSERIENPGGYMHATVKFCALDILKQRKRITYLDDSEVCATEDVSEQATTKYDIIRAMSDLSEDEREIAIRHFLFGEKIKEIKKDHDLHYDSLRRKLREIRRKINSKL